MPKYNRSLSRQQAGEILQQINMEVQQRQLSMEELSQGLEDSYRRCLETMEQRKLLVLANRDNPIEPGYVPELQDIGNHMQLDSRCAGALLDMIKQCREAGLEPYICSAYRTNEKQQELYENKVQRLLALGLDNDSARQQAAMSVAIPGTSEHQLGLAVDIIDSFYTNLDAGQENTATQQWLMENCWRFGFILRYPNGTTDITGIIYEPWHYRYVGIEYAQAIHESGLTLEEFVAQRRGR